MVGTSLVLLVLYSPALFETLPLQPRNWSKLSEVGQAYGGISAILSATALLGIAISLMMQMQQTRLARRYSIRVYQLELYKLIARHPQTYWPVITGQRPLSTGKIRRQVFRTAFLQYTYLALSSGLFDEETFRVEILPHYFSSPENRSTWPDMRRDWEVFERDRKSGRQFLALVDHEYRRAADFGAVHTKDSGAGAEEPSHGPHRRRLSMSTLALGATLVAVGIVQHVRRRGARQSCAPPSTR